MFANFRLLNFGFALVGTGLGGILGQTIGYRETLAVAVALMYASTLILLSSPVRKVGRIEAQDVVAEEGVA